MTHTGLAARWDSQNENLWNVASERHLMQSGVELTATVVEL